jgi:exonuclease III
MATIKIATLNINGMTSPTRIAMLGVLLRRQEIDILLVQEVKYDVLNDFQGYTTQYNIGANRRSTAIVERDGINLENIIMSPSGRARAAKFREIWIINVHTPSGTAMKQERERFFNSELPYLLTGETGHMLLVGI